MLEKRAPLEGLLSREALTKWSAVDGSLGDLFYSLDGAAIERGKHVPRGHRLPVVLNSQKIVCGDLIPDTSWGSSLSNMLTKKSWDAIRHPLIEKNNNVCEVCGTRHKTLDVHEVWGYSFPSETEVQKAQEQGASAFGTQSLDGLVTVCTECHKMYHLGLANVRGELDQVLARMGAINGWSDSQVSQYYDLVAARYEQASKIYWALDFFNLRHPEGGLTLKSAWAAHEDEPRLLANEGRFGQNVTAILNIPWKHHKDAEWHKALTQEDFDD